MNEKLSTVKATFRSRSRIWVFLSCIVGQGQACSRPTDLTYSESQNNGSSAATGSPGTRRNARWASKREDVLTRDGTMREANVRETNV